MSRAGQCAPRPPYYCHYYMSVTGGPETSRLSCIPGKRLGSREIPVSHRTGSSGTTHGQAFLRRSKPVAERSRTNALFSSSARPYLSNNLELCVRRLKMAENQQEQSRSLRDQDLRLVR